MKKKVKRKVNIREELTFYGFVSPWIIGFLCFTFIPMVLSVYYSFFSLSNLSLAMGNPAKHVGFAHFVDIFTKNREFGVALGNTLLYSVVRVFGGTVISFIFAVLLNRNMPGKKIFRTLIYIPAIIPKVGSAIVWQAVFDESFSFFNFLLNGIGLPSVDWLGKKRHGLGYAYEHMVRHRTDDDNNSRGASNRPAGRARSRGA